MLAGRVPIIISSAVVFLPSVAGLWHLCHSFVFGFVMVSYINKNFWNTYSLAWPVAQKTLQYIGCIVTDIFDGITTLHNK
jgi:hypothetical protein